MRLLAPLFLLLSSFAFSASTASPRWSLRFQPARVVNGSPILFRATTPQPLRTLSGNWLGHEVPFSFNAAHKYWFALAGVSEQTKPGDYTLELHGETSAGQAISFQKQVKVWRQRYPTVMLKVPSRYTAPSPEEQQRIAEDKTVKEQFFQTVTPEREWKGSFVAPVKAPISDIFGVQRVFNGTVQSTHQGLDFRVPPGTPVNAINSGTVLLARPLFFEGKCVVIDHGQGLLTLYLHLSQIDVKEGDKVSKAQQVGLSGGTGRATGPHLHLAVRWQGVYLNPAALLALHLP